MLVPASSRWQFLKESLSKRRSWRQCIACYLEGMNALQNNGTLKPKEEGEREREKVKKRESIFKLEATCTVHVTSGYLSRVLSYSTDDGCHGEKMTQQRDAHFPQPSEPAITFIPF